MKMEETEGCWLEAAPEWVEGAHCPGEESALHLGGGPSGDREGGPRLGHRSGRGRAKWGW